MTAWRVGFAVAALAGALGLVLGLSPATASAETSDGALTQQDDQERAQLRALMGEITELAAQIDAQIVDLREELFARPGDDDLRAMLDGLEADRAALAALFADMEAVLSPAAPPDDP